MLVKDIILELYDPEGKYTGNKPPNTPPPRGRGGPDWEGDDDSLWREFFQLMREKLIELNFKILYPRQASDTELLLDASWPQTKTDGTSGVMRVKFNLDSGDTTATLHVLAYKNIISTSEPWQNRRFRIRITDFDWALRKISTIQAVLKQTRPTTESILTEAATDNLYHFMNTRNAERTLANGFYSLESSTGLDVEERFAPKGKPWYLATTRSKVGDYTVRNASTSGALFEIDGRWINTRYETHPIDYWSFDPESIKKRHGEKWRDIPHREKRSMWQYDPSRTSESEDRIFSQNNIIPLRGSTTAVHVFIIPMNQLPEYRDPEHQQYRAAEIRRIYQHASQRNIPVYLYDNKQKWMTMRSQYRIDPASEYGQKLLQGKELISRTRPQIEDRYYSSPYYWLELLHKNPATDSLSEKAEKLKNNLFYYSDTIRSLQTDLHNAARNPEDENYRYLIDINKFMTKNKLYNLSDLEKYLKNKWADKRY